MKINFVRLVYGGTLVFLGLSSITVGPLLLITGISAGEEGDSLVMSGVLSIIVSFLTLYIGTSKLRSVYEDDDDTKDEQRPEQSPTVDDSQLLKKALEKDSESTHDE